ncbi:DUF2442 domain-containing protein [Campylobacter troglodytis]|uniref:DUF2442 domain-containing protein n=1 Tax=Campylobacter troglodytis TaxID=654363 RepID=UPI00115A32C8|nr:DUF2442 domain-containing protein [Campylobacter troglodytis]TQR54780.1 DUF2442 domain-containing protein [Campylobacter troglodytis]
MSILVKAKSVGFENGYLVVLLQDERIIQTPLKWYKELKDAPLAELEKWHFICDGTGIEWENLNCHLSVESMLKSSIEVA